jgi:tetratricopeptide (TPR) repeat protein
MERFRGNSGDDAVILDFLDRVDYLSRGLHQHEAALEMLDDVPREFLWRNGALPARLRVERAAVRERQGTVAEAARLYREALAMMAGTRRLATLADCLEGLARCGAALGQLEQAEALWEQALQSARQRHSAAGQERAHRQLGRLLAVGGRGEQARAHYEAALALGRASENWAGVIDDLAGLADLAGRSGQAAARTPYEAERQRLRATLRDLAHVGRGAPPRAQAVRDAQAALPEIGATTRAEGADLMAAADEAYRQAATLRREEKHQQAVPLYQVAVACWHRLDAPQPLIAGLNGLGLSYRALAHDAFRRELLALGTAADPSRYLTSPIRYRDAFREGQTRGLAEKARACHRWALELCKAMDYYIGQANQVSNLGVVEAFLGNVDSAARYQRWAAQAHRDAGCHEAAAADLRELAQLELQLGDEAAAAEWERQAQEVSNAG